MIGEQFDSGEEICGAVVNVRAKQEKISIWTKNGLNEASQVCIEILFGTEKFTPCTSNLSFCGVLMIQIF